MRPHHSLHLVCIVHGSPIRTSGSPSHSHSSLAILSVPGHAKNGIASIGEAADSFVSSSRHSVAECIFHQFQTQTLFAQGAEGAVAVYEHVGTVSRACRRLSLARSGKCTFLVALLCTKRLFFLSFPPHRASHRSARPVTSVPLSFYPTNGCETTKKKPYSVLFQGATRYRLLRAPVIAPLAYRIHPVPRGGSRSVSTPSPTIYSKY